MTDILNRELLQPGQTVLNDQYTIERHIGSGGQGQVYLASHQVFGQRAVKRLHKSGDPSQEGERFGREVKITHELHQSYGEHVILIYHFDRDQNGWFSVMEYANQGSLDEKLALGAPLRVEEAIKLAIDLCQALAPIHKYPYIHGDLKPGNILFHIRRNQTAPVIKLGDFGSAFKPRQDEFVPMSTSLLLPRTLPYVAPELLLATDIETKSMDPGKIDQRADIYAVGIILYEMLTGRPPFWKPIDPSAPLDEQNRRQQEIIERIISETPANPTSLQQDVPLSLSWLVMQAISKNPLDRFENVGHMQAKLEEILKEERLQVRQRLVSLREQLEHKMKEGSWREAETLVEQALKIEPDDAQLFFQKEEINDQLVIDQLLLLAREAEIKSDWSKVVLLCRQASDLHRYRSEISTLLKQAETQIAIGKRRGVVDRLLQQGSYQAALRELQALQKEIPGELTLAEEINTLQKKIDLETYYAQGKAAYEAKHWSMVIEVMDKVAAIDPFYQDAASYRLAAQLQLAQTEQVIYVDQRERELQRLLQECNEAIQQEEWLVARAKLQAVYADRSYEYAVEKRDVLCCLFYLKGHRYAEAGQWYIAQLYFNRVAKYNPTFQNIQYRIIQAQQNNRLLTHYRIKSLIVEGESSQLYLAEDLNRDKREICLKYLKGSTDTEQWSELNRQFRRQAWRCIELNHPHIVKTLAVEMRDISVGDEGSEIDVPVVVMEYIEGQTLAEYLRQQGKLSYKQAIAFTRQLCQALVYAHERGVLHLDIKLSNVLLHNGVTLKLTDFGQTVKGTSSYSAPEQFRIQERKLDQRTDIFATGKVLYALLSGVAPLENLLDESSPNFQDISSPLQEVIRRATAPNPEDRYQTAQEMLVALDKVEARLPMELNLYERSKNLWLKTSQAWGTWKVALVIGVLMVLIILTFVARPLFADPNTTGEKIWETMAAFVSVPIPTAISSSTAASIVTSSATPTPSASPTDLPTSTPTPEEEVEFSVPTPYTPALAEAWTATAQAIAETRAAEATIVTATSTKTATATSVPPTPMATSTETATPTSSPTYTPSPTDSPTPTSTSTPIPLLPAVVIDTQESQQDQDKLNYEGRDSFKWLRWKSWPENNEENISIVLPPGFPEQWVYIVSFLSATDFDDEFKTVIVERDEIEPGKDQEYLNGKNVDNTNWYTYSFDLDKLPLERKGCYPYWDVIVAVDEDLVNCPEEQKYYEGLCQITSFPQRQVYLADRNPKGDCSEVSGERSSTRAGSSNNRGPDDLDD